MGDYATAATDVEPLLGGRTFGASAIVTEAQADLWVDQAERELVGTIAASGGSTDYTGSTHASAILREWVSVAVSGKCFRAYAAAAGDGSNDDGVEEMNGWKELLLAIRTNPIHFVNMLGATASQSVAGIRSHAVSADEETAQFKMSEKF